MTNNERNIGKTLRNLLIGSTVTLAIGMAAVGYSDYRFISARSELPTFENRERENKSYSIGYIGIGFCVLGFAGLGALAVVGKDA